MEPVLSVTIGAVFAVVLTNLVWWGSTRSLRRGGPNPALQAELQGVKAQLVGHHLALVEAVRPVLSDRETTPTDTAALLARLVQAHRDGRTEGQQLRYQLGSATRRVAQVKRELAHLRQGAGTDAMREHLALVSSERDALQEKVSDLAQRVRRSNPTTLDSLNAARQEVNRLREQLQTANRAIATLDVAPMGPPRPLPDPQVRIDLEDDPTDTSQADQSRPPVLAEHLGHRWR